MRHKPEDDDIGRYAGDNVNPGLLYGKELWDEVRGVCDQAHEMLGSEVSGGTGETETELACLDISRAASDCAAPGCEGAVQAGRRVVGRVIPLE